MSKVFYRLTGKRMVTEDIYVHLVYSLKDDVWLDFNLKEKYSSPLELQRLIKAGLHFTRSGSFFEIVVEKLFIGKLDGHQVTEIYPSFLMKDGIPDKNIPKQKVTELQ